MRSSISNSSGEPKTRSWGVIWAVAAIVALSAAATYELIWRYAGAEPTIDDDLALWALNREMVSQNDGRKPLALLGTSRMHAGFCAQAFDARHPGYKSVQLAWEGAHPLAVLEHLSKDVNFVGHVIVELDVTSFFPDKINSQRMLVNYYDKNWSVIKKAERLWTLFLEGNFVIFSYETNPLRLMESVLLDGRLPRFGHYAVQRDRNLHLDYDGVDTTQRLKSRISHARARVEIDRIISLSAVLAEAAKVKPWVEAIERRGGKVVFVHSPIHPELYKAETYKATTKKYWNSIMRSNAFTAVHFADFQELRSFRPLDGVHLDFRTKCKFTEELMKVVEQKIEF